MWIVFVWVTGIWREEEGRKSNIMKRKEGLRWEKK
jgi:hypothetical protein